MSLTVPLLLKRSPRHHCRELPSLHEYICFQISFVISLTNLERCFHIKEELRKLDFCKIPEVETCEIVNGKNAGILIEYTGVGLSQAKDINSIPVIYPFDFLEGAGAIVVFPEDERVWLEKQNVRQWAAEYMSGYCAFWNVEGCDWLYDAMPLIKGNITSEAALKTAAHICARIAANIAVGRNVKRYPRYAGT